VSQDFASGFFSTTSAANFAAIVNYTGGKFETGPNDTGDKFRHLYSWYR
jgi:hypothetical protein